MLKRIRAVLKRLNNRKAELLRSQADLMFAKFQQGGSNYIDQAIVLDRKALELYPSDHPHRWDALNQLQLHLLRRYECLGMMEDIEEAVVLGRRALNIHPHGHPDLLMCLDTVARLLSDRYKKLGSVGDLEDAIVLGREALHVSPPGHSDRITRLVSVAVDLHDRYEKLGKMEDLGDAIVLAREALNLCPQGHPDRPLRLDNVAVYLSDRSMKLGSIADLEDAIVLRREALDLCPQGHPDRSMRLGNISVYLRGRYRKLGRMADLEEAIALAREALDLCPQGHPDRSMCLANVAMNLRHRYRKLGSMEDMEEAIVLARESLDLCPVEHADRSKRLAHVGMQLRDRYKKLGGIADLEDAILLAQEALNVCPQGHPDRSLRLGNVAIYLSDRHRKLGRMRDLEEAIVFGRAALALCTKRHRDRSLHLDSVAGYLYDRYGKLGEVVDLEEAIVLGREALELRPQGNPHRPGRLGNLAIHLRDRYTKLGKVADLEEAIVLARDALEICPQGHPDWSIRLGDIASHLRTRFTQLKQPRDQEEVFDLYSRLMNVSETVFLSDFHLSKTWVNAAEEFYHPTTFLAYQTALRLLTHYITALPSLPQHLSILQQSTSSLAVDAFSASLRQNHPENAVELLEQGRGVFWNQLSRLRSPLDDVAASGTVGSVLAERFAQLTSEIRDTIGSLTSADRHDRLCCLNFEMQKVVASIRNLPGLGRFHLSPLFSDLRHAARDGPVIIVNASDYGCDALVIFADQDPVHLPLQITKARARDLAAELQLLTLRAKTMNVARDLCLLLRDLWDEVVSPIVDFLLTAHPPRSRIWWCPTAEFSLLPLHAAGPYRRGPPNLSHLYTSSYTPTLSALIRARRREPSDSATGGKHFVAVGQAKAVGESELVSVGRELVSIAQRIQGLAKFTPIEGSDSCIARVSEELAKSAWVHLACHGLPDRQRPFDSAFAFHDGHFTIERIMQCELDNAEFAYLSACHTTVGDEESPDEVIHLASAMQFAGFRSVIGTMWAVDDEHTTKISSAFYDHMVDASGRLDYTRAACALNETMNTLEDIPFDQRILYVHIGA